MAVVDKITNQQTSCVCQYPFPPDSRTIFKVFCGEMKFFCVIVACAILAASNERCATLAYTFSPIKLRSPSYFPRDFRLKSAAETEMTTAINKVMRSTPPPHIPAESVIQHTALLVALWNKVAFPNEDDEDTDFILGDYGLSRKDVGGFITHFQTCKDCAADHAFLMATQDDSGADVLRLSNVYFPVLTEVDNDSDW